MKGRLNWFIKARPYLSILYDKKHEKYLCPQGRMQDLMKYALGYQFYISKQEKPDTTPNFRSLLNDLVTSKQTAKFNSQHLNEFTFSFSK